MKSNRLIKKKSPVSYVLTLGVFITGLLIFNIQCLFSQTPDLYTTSFQNDAVGRYDGETGAYKGYFVSPGSGGLDRPQKVFFHPTNGNLLVTGFLNTQIKMYNGETGAFIGNFSSGYSLASPTKMILGRDSLLYVSQWGGKVVRFTLNGSFVDEFTSINIPAGLGMIWDDDDNLYVTSWGSDGFDGRVYKFDSQGNSLGTFISSSQLDGPVGVWRDDAGDFYVVDWRKGSVLRFDSNGAFKGTFISGTERTEGHAFGADGSIYLCNVQVNKVVRYNSNGSFDKVFIDNNLAGPNSITFGPVMTPTENPVFSNSIHINVFPNPVVKKATIQFELPSSEFVNLKIVNEAGQAVDYLKKASLSAGKHQVDWDASHFSSGIYFLHLEVRDEVFTERLTIAR